MKKKVTQSLTQNVFTYDFPPKSTYKKHKIHRYYKIDNQWKCKCRMPIEIAMFGEAVRRNDFYKFITHTLLWNDYNQPLIIKHKSPIILNQLGKRKK